MGAFASAVLAAVGFPAPAFVSSSALPPVESMRPAPISSRPERRSGSGTSVTSGILTSLDTNSETKGSNWYGSLGADGISAKMLRNPHVSQSVGYVVNPLRAATWRFKPASKSPRDREVASYCDYSFLECLPWTLVVDRMVSGYTVDGFALAEMTDEVREIPTERFPLHPGAGRGLVPTGLDDIPANTIHYWRKSKANPTQLESIDQWQPYSDNEESGFRNISADRIIRITVGQKGGNFTGIPILRSAYSAWLLLDMFERFRAMALERTSLGTPTATASADISDEEIAEVKKVLENMRNLAKGSAVFPEGVTINWEGAGENDVENLNIAIESLKTDIAVNVTCGFSRLGLTGPGSYALADSQQGQYHLSSVGHADLFALSFNLGRDGWSPVRRIVEANYGVGTPLPRLVARNLPTRDIKTILPLIYQAIAAEAMTPDEPLEEEIREMVQVGPRDFDTARRSYAVGAPVVAAVGGSEGADVGEVQPESDEQAPDAEKVADEAPDDTTRKEDQTIFGYHLQYGVATINEARKNLNLPPRADGDQTVPAYLSNLEPAEQADDQQSSDEPAEEQAA